MMLDVMRSYFKMDLQISKAHRYLGRSLVCIGLVCSFLAQHGIKAQPVLPPNFNSLAAPGPAFEQPVGVAWDQSGRQFVWEKGGKVWVVVNGVRNVTPLLDISEEVGNWRDHGMLGFALDPAFLTNGRFYVSYVVDRHHLMNFGSANYSATTNDYYSATIIRITRYTAPGPDHVVADPGSRTILLGATPQTGAPVTHESHGCGSLVFGNDGTLMASIGDNASYFGIDMGNAWESYFLTALTDGILRPSENVGAFRAQILGCLNGKILRLDPNTGNGVSSNPWYNASAPGSTTSKVWALGVRNPYRMTHKQGTGSTDPADGRPGVFYFGDVGQDSWEEQNVCIEKGLNFGWPLFEGLTQHEGFMLALTENRDAPNPGYNGINCTRQYFYFQDLLKQDTRQLLGNFPTPCDSTLQIPSNVPTYLHKRPSIDYLHGILSRVGAYNGNDAVYFYLDDPNSPVPGPRFGGNAAIGGPFMAASGFPVEYQNSAFHGDYGQGWIRRFNYDETDSIESVHNFATGLGPMSWLGEGPDGCLWYIKYDSGELERICYTANLNLPPTAVATQDLEYGPGPLSVNFTGSNSTDPEGLPLSYSWDFGIGTSTIADPTQVFPSPPGVVTTYTVTLTVTDDIGQISSAELIVSVNNTPPEVEITSIPDEALYPVGIDTTYVLTASVTDGEHGPGELTYSWRTTLFHNTHNHPEPLDQNENSSTMISGVGCGSEPFHYSVGLTVTDAGGLSGHAEKELFPNCRAIAPIALFTSDVIAGFGPLVVSFDGSSSYDPGTIVSYDWDFGDGHTSSSVTPSNSFATEGEYEVVLTVTDDDGLTGTVTRLITVLSTAPPQCVGEPGTLLREVWNGINGIAVLDLLNSPNYLDLPNATTMITEFASPINVGNNYGQRIRGSIQAPETGNYVFTVTGDDNVAVYLGLNAESQFKELICSIPLSTTYNDFFAFPQQISTSKYMEAGRYYYVEVLHKEGSGADFVALWWQTPSNNTRTIIPGSVLTPWTDCGPNVQLRFNLQGPWNDSTHLMNDDLRLAGLVPSTEPYAAAGFALVGSGGETVSEALLDVEGSNAVVDWALVELRNALDPTQIVATRSVLLQRDGDVIGTDGYKKLIFDQPVGEYFVAVRHRNHLGAMTLNAITLDGSAVILDLTDGSVPMFGTAAQTGLMSDENGLWSGNAVRDGLVKYTGSGNDRDPILVAVGGSTPSNVISGYSVLDVNLDGLIKYTGIGNDRDLILQNLPGLIITGVRREQLP